MITPEMFADLSQKGFAETDFGTKSKQALEKLIRERHVWCQDNIGRQKQPPLIVMETNCKLTEIFNDSHN